MTDSVTLPMIQAGPSPESLPEGLYVCAERLDVVKIDKLH